MTRDAHELQAALADVGAVDPREERLPERLLAASVEGFTGKLDAFSEAINEGRGAARECDRYLMGSTDLP